MTQVRVVKLRETQPIGSQPIDVRRSDFTTVAAEIGVTRELWLRYVIIGPLVLLKSLAVYRSARSGLSFTPQEIGVTRELWLR